MHIAVCDDNVGDRKQLERLLSRESENRADSTGVFYIDSYGNMNAVLNSPMIYDAFFVDMVASDSNTSMLVPLLWKAGVTAPIILCSSCIDYKNAFSTSQEKTKNNLMYLDKPIKTSELTKILDTIIRLKGTMEPTIELRGEKYTRYAAEDDIVYARAEGNYIHVYLKDGSTLDVLSTLDSFYSQLASFSHYAAVSRISMVNVTFLRKVTFTKLYLIDGTVIKTTPSYSSDIKKALQQFVEEL